MTPKCSNPLQSVAKSLVDIAGQRILSPLRLPIPPSGLDVLHRERGPLRVCATAPNLQQSATFSVTSLRRVNIAARLLGWLATAGLAREWQS
jgi:hypothetical protein